MFLVVRNVEPEKIGITITTVHTRLRRFIRKLGALITLECRDMPSMPVLLNWYSSELAGEIWRVPDTNFDTITGDSA